MGLVIPLKKEINNSYLELKNLVGNKLDNVNQQIKYKLASEINLIHKTTGQEDDKHKIDFVVSYFKYDCPVQSFYLYISIFPKKKDVLNLN